MRTILCFTLLIVGIYANSGYSNHQLKKEFTQKVENVDLRLYTLTGTFVLGTLTYSYTIVVDATICIICNPPTITINGIESLTICLQGTQICGSWGVSRIQHDQNNNLEYIEFWVDNIQNEDEIERHVNGEDFQQEIKDKLLNY